MLTNREVNSIALDRARTRGAIDLHGDAGGPEISIDFQTNKELEVYCIGQIERLEAELQFSATRISSPEVHEQVSRQLQTAIALHKSALAKCVKRTFPISHRDLAERVLEKLSPKKEGKDGVGSIDLFVKAHKGFERSTFRLYLNGSKISPESVAAIETAIEIHAKALSIPLRR